MLYRVLADIVVVIHCAFVIFVVLGGLLVLRWPRAAWVHLPAAAWGAIIEFAGWICPLTPLEQWLRRRAGEEGHEGGFVERYIFGALYPEGLTREFQIGLGVFVILLNVGIYWFGWARRH
ncbi:MAG TPA: DUF2784 domain-containing protein [Thermoanaerobaculia bacterium]|nr:DUF2784 domain-containing protein [Thermoanaerobaculia bacterium]